MADDDFENLDDAETPTTAEEIFGGAELNLCRGDRVNKAALCKMLGKSDATVSKYMAEGMPILRKGSRREGYEFDTAAVVGWLAKYAVEMATGDPDTMSLEKAKRRTIAAQARMRELEFDKASGETMYRKDLAEIADARFGELRSRIISIPATLTGLTPENEEQLAAAINDALSELSSPTFWIPPDGLLLPSGDDYDEGEFESEDDSEGDS